MAPLGGAKSHNHIGRMAKPSNRERLLSEGLRVVHANGFTASGVRDIVHAAGVPQGSFTNHFTSKEAFGLEILELYHARALEQIAQTLRNDSLAPMQRLRQWLDGQIVSLKANDMRAGCLYGNFTAECSELSDPIRERMCDIFAETQDAVTYCLRAAARAGELTAGADVENISGFIVSSMQGAILLAKCQRSAMPIERFVHVLFNEVLRPEAH